MTNLEWLEKMKIEIPSNMTEVEEANFYIDRGIPSISLNHRQVKALEIIAEELIDINRLLRIYIINTGFKINDIQ